jgi:hypothetical protein
MPATRPVVSVLLSFVGDVSLRTKAATPPGHTDPTIQPSRRRPRTALGTSFSPGLRPPSAGHHLNQPTGPQPTTTVTTSPSSVQVTRHSPPPAAGGRDPPWISDTEEVTGSNPVAPTIPVLTSGNAGQLAVWAGSAGRAPQPGQTRRVVQRMTPLNLVNRLRSLHLWGRHGWSRIRSGCPAFRIKCLGATCLTSCRVCAAAPLG